MTCHFFFYEEFQCRCLANNASCWPNASDWQNFNASINGQLISVQPSAAGCTGNPPDMNLCNLTLIQWTNAVWRSDQPGAMQSPNWENSTCSENEQGVSCTQGSVPRFGVKATTIEQIQATIQFASTHNLRLVIKTTGHDYLGRSTAADSLLLWVHHMKDIRLIPQYNSCTGEQISNPIRVAAGVQWGEVYTWLSQFNLIAIGGASPTVGATGGYLQGGGHGPLTRWKGMAADQILEFEVVTADGVRRIANACENTDLFWALRGGGGGTYAVVVSVVLRTFPSPPMSAVITVVAAETDDRYAQFLKDFVQFLPALSDAGWSGYFYITDRIITIAFFVPSRNFTGDMALYLRLLQNTTGLHIVRNDTYSFASFYDLFVATLSQSNSGGGSVLLGSRLVPETIVRNRGDQLADIFFKSRGESTNLSLLIGHLVAGGEVSQISVDNSINPAWRRALLHMISTQGLPDNVSTSDMKRLLADLRQRVDLLQTVTEGEESGCYMNEADANEPNWQQKFFGPRQLYDRLKSIKRKFDPNDLFICKNCVGSEDWTDDLNCRKASSSNRISNHSFFILFVIKIFYWIY